MIIDGNLVSKKIKTDLIDKISLLKDKPKLVVIQIGDDEASNIYIKAKEKVALEINIDFEHLKYNEKIEELEVINKIIALNNDNSISGIMVQLPLPKGFNERRIINSIDYRKDVDGLTDINTIKLINKEDCIIPCTALGIIRLLDYYNINTSNKNVVIINRGILIGKPIFNLLLNKNATITMCHSKTNNLNYFTSNADIIITATGKRDLIKRNMLKKNAIIIDAGINRFDGNVCGDVDFQDVYNRVSYITPVPGGVGPMTVICLMENTLKAHILKDNS